MPLLLGFIILAIDIATKFLTQEHLPLMSRSSPWYPYGGVGVFENFFGIQFSITHATNLGAAWGVLSDYSTLLLLLRLVLIGGLIIYYPRTRGVMRYALALILAGAIGNVIDIALYGHVVDMFHFVFWGYDYPVFNVADSAIFIGVLLSLRQQYASNKVA